MGFFKSDDKATSPMGNSQDNPVTESPATIEQQTAPLAEKHKRATRSDKGKPRQPREQAQVQGQVFDPANAVNLELVKKSVSAIFGAVDGLVCRSIGTKAGKLGVDATLADSLVQSVALTRSEQEIISESTALICIRYEFIMRHAPEFMLAGVMASWGVRIVTVHRKLDALEEAIKEARKKAQAPAATSGLEKITAPDNAQN
jgi:hypothetical protein